MPIKWNVTLEEEKRCQLQAEFMETTNSTQLNLTTKAISSDNFTFILEYDEVGSVMTMIDLKQETIYDFGRHIQCTRIFFDLQCIFSKSKSTMNVSGHWYSNYLCDSVKLCLVPVTKHGIDLKIQEVWPVLYRVQVKRKEHGRYDKACSMNICSDGNCRKGGFAPSIPRMRYLSGPQRKPEIFTRKLGILDIESTDTDYKNEFKKIKPIQFNLENEKSNIEKNFVLDPELDHELNMVNKMRIKKSEVGCVVSLPELGREELDIEVMSCDDGGKVCDYQQVPKLVYSSHAFPFSNFEIRVTKHENMYAKKHLSESSIKVIDCELQKNAKLVESNINYKVAVGIPLFIVLIAVVVFVVVYKRNQQKGRAINTILNSVE
ncbi:hypothetical protein Ciccas_013199 [Cichlidogyrus casuarinus]|uniref:ZP domain-containing protein n=1 Tax=Cichlidogyrus casuarinus TaxID=1844966 RepID=A0ABD2PRA5_9PLAT